jgi:site-specific DNA-methyltransferase (adenine-specific)
MKKARRFQLDRVIEGDNARVLAAVPDGSIDLTVTSPPYDDLRDYGGHAFDFAAVARELARVTAEGGVIVWVVADESRCHRDFRPGETGTSFRQALHFMGLGLTLHDTMIARKTLKTPKQRYRYEQCFDFMFVFCKGPRPKTANIRRVPCVTAGKVCVLPGNHDLDYKSDKVRKAATERTQAVRRVVVKDDKPDGNVWHYDTGMGHTATDRLASRHPAPFPEKLAADHIESWSEPGDVVLDPFCGSGTTCKMAKLADRHFIGIDACPEYVGLARERLRFYHRRTRLPGHGTRGGRPACLPLPAPGKDGRSSRRSAAKGAARA